MSRPKGPAVEPAKDFSSYYEGTYRVRTKELAMRRGPWTSKQVLKTLQHGDEVKCYGFFTKTDMATWLVVRDEHGDAGYCSYRCLYKV